MIQCKACSVLAANALRADVPKHLKRFVVRDNLFGLKKITAFECRKCSSLWRWDRSENWVCIASPKPCVPRPMEPVAAGSLESTPLLPAPVPMAASISA